MDRGKPETGVSDHATALAIAAVLGSEILGFLRAQKTCAMPPLALPTPPIHADSSSRRS